MHVEATPELRIEAADGLCRVTLNRPDELNAVNESLHTALTTVWAELAEDPVSKVVLLTGAGRAFSAGGDLDWITANLDDPAAQQESLDQVQRISEAMLAFPLPIVAAVNGPAVGLGCSIAMLCDVVLMAESASLADPHVSVGLVAGDGSAAFWPRLAPIMRLREHLFTGDPIPAKLAAEIGLVSRVVPDDDLADEAERVARRLARQPVAALRGTKRVLNMHLSAALSSALPAGLAAEAETMRSDGHRERVLELGRRARERRRG